MKTLLYLQLWLALMAIGLTAAFVAGNKLLLPL